MMFFLWLAGGAGVFSKINEWSYGDGRPFCLVGFLSNSV